MRHLLMIAFHFPPDVSAGSYRSMRFAKYLQRLGWNISVLTVDRQDGSSKSGLEPPEGVSIHRARMLDWLAAVVRLRTALRRSSTREGTTPVAGTGRNPDAPLGHYWQRLKDTLSLVLTFPDAAIGWFPLAVYRGWRISRSEGIDVIYSSGPPHSCHLVGWALKVLTGRPWVADFRDPWARKSWLQGHERRLWRQRGIGVLERLVVGSADRVILNTDRMRDDFLSNYRPLNERFVSLPNGFDPEEFPEPPSARNDGPIRIVHAGTLYRRRNPLVLLQAVDQLIRAGALSRADVEICFLGSVALPGLSIEDAAREMGLGEVVKLVPHVPHRECLSRMYESDILLIVQPETETQVPGKIYEYLYIGKPILALAHAGATADFVSTYRLGRVANPDRLDEVTAAVRSLCVGPIERIGNAPALERLRHKHDARSLTQELHTVLVGCMSRDQTSMGDAPG